MNIDNITQEVISKADTEVETRVATAKPLRSLSKKEMRDDNKIVTKRLKGLALAKASDVEITRMYAEKHGLDPNNCTVADIISHVQLYWAINGSAPHMQMLLERTDGKVATPVESKEDKSGKLSITDAVKAMRNGN